MNSPQTGRRIGDVILDFKNISLSFGGVRALTDISFDVREHEIRAIIGPNGAGKSSMLNVINGVYRPQHGEIIYRGQHRKNMNTYAAAKSGIARTFQNIALFKGMTVLDNIMTGRNLKMKCNFLLQALHLGPARREEMANRAKVMGTFRRATCETVEITVPTELFSPDPISEIDGRSTAISRSRSCAASVT